MQYSTSKEKITLGKKADSVIAPKHYSTNRCVSAHIGIKVASDRYSGKQNSIRTVNFSDYNKQEAYRKLNKKIQGAD